MVGKNVETNMVAPGHVEMAGKMLKNDGGTWTYRDVQKNVAKLS